MADAGALVREARRRHGLDQRALARRAGTSQTQVSRIERGVVSPTVASLARLLEAAGERLELRAAPAPRPGSKHYFPDHAAERRGDLDDSTPAERVAAAIALSRTATTIAARARRAP
jgi:transcriptional regulator with XRE-family HTH domain